MQIADCVEQSCELVEAYYCSDITVALIVLNLVELKNLCANFVGFNKVCAYLYGHRVLVHSLLYCLWFCDAQGSFSSDNVRPSFV